jgi:hypothetical protein
MKQRLIEIVLFIIAAAMVILPMFLKSAPR